MFVTSVGAYLSKARYAPNSKGRLLALTSNVWLNLGQNTLAFYAGTSLKKIDGPYKWASIIS
jgi:hypothetical protein